MRSLPVAAQVFIGAVVLLTAWASVNWVYQVIRKPTELFFPVSGSLAKQPDETWEHYGSLFTKHSTAIMTPEFLAALAQVEGSGNPVARTYWKVRLTWNPFEMYRPASSAVGMFQITDAAFREARRLCIHDHEVVEEGPWYDAGSCWFNDFYSRVVPSHAVEMTSAFLARSVTRVLRRNRIAGATLQEKQNLAAVIHLCGAHAGGIYARDGFRLTGLQRCGDHNVGRYLMRVDDMKQQFARMKAVD